MGPDAMFRALYNGLGHVLSRHPRRWHPLLAVYYLTYRCDFRCPFCSDGAAQPYYRLEAAPLAATRVIDLLGRVRRRCDHLVITGGEPMQHPEIDAVLEGLPALGFDGIVFTTNGYGVEPHLPALARSVRWLVFSLETLDPGKADRWFGRGPGTLARILANIDAAASLPGRPYEIIISSVATPDTLDDLYGVYDYARTRGFRFALCPQLVGVKAHEALADDPRYRRLFDHLIAEKKRGEAVNGSVLYLEHMRDLREFHCRPSAVLALAPGGEVFYPCLERGQTAGNLLETADLDRIRRMGEAAYGPEPDCDNRCHSACALGFSLAFNHPLSNLSEGFLQLKGAMLRRFQA